jgi:response regulator RpfG family c-di-GMP phosphodiesterase
MKQLKERHVVVLVDDEPEVLSALRRALRREPYQVLTTSRPAEALKWVEAIDVSAVVSDQRMPGMTGTELLGRVSERSPATTCVMLTAYGPEAAEQPGVRHSVECILSKPWDDGMLRNALREFLFEREIEDPRWTARFERKGAKGQVP